jgi:hypothetical protein
MNIKPPDHHGEIQYIATQQCLRTLLSGMSVSLDLLHDSDFIADPGVDEPGYQGIGHRSEQTFLWEYRQHRRAIKAEARQLEMRQPDAPPQNRAVPFYLIAMALRRSPEGKPRVVITDDPGLIEWMQFFGVETMESAEFIRLILSNSLVDSENAAIIHPDPNQHPHPDAPYTEF